MPRSRKHGGGSSNVVILQDCLNGVQSSCTSLPRWILISSVGLRVDEVKSYGKEEGIVPILRVGSDRTQTLHDPHATEYTSEYGVLLIQIWSRCKGNEELASVGIWPTVRHTKYSCTSKSEVRVYFVLTTK